MWRAAWLAGWGDISLVVGEGGRRSGVNLPREQTDPELDFMCILSSKSGRHNPIGDAGML